MHGGNIDPQVFAGMSAVLGQRGMSAGLPKLETRSLSMDFANNGLPTAPVFSPDFHNANDLDPLGFGSSTINPKALHFSDSPQSMVLDSATSQFSQGLHDSSTANSHFEDDFNWRSGGFDRQMTFNSNQDSAIDGSSPSAISTNSQSVTDPMVDGSTHHGVAVNATSMWQPSIMGTSPVPIGNWDMGETSFPDLMPGAPLSAQTDGQKGIISEPYISNPPSFLNALNSSVMAGLNTQSMNQVMDFPARPETPTSLNGNNSASPVSTFTDATRNALQSSLSQCSTFRGRKFSSPKTQFPLSPHHQPSTNSPDAVKSLPSTMDLQRYLDAYIRYFHPHLPFMHIPTLSFELGAKPSSGRPPGGRSGSLTLSMAAIGALYEGEPIHSRELFDSAKAMIKLYLEERRKENARRGEFRLSPVVELGSHQQSSPDKTGHTPLWLVQAMLLNVIYGHNLADKTVGESSYNHCNALISLARAAHLMDSPSATPTKASEVTITGVPSWGKSSHSETEEHTEWLRWKMAEERKRTLFVIYILQSMLISAYNHQPLLTHSELTMQLPCDEDFFSAESSATFNAKGGISAAARDSCTFREALEYFLSVSKRQEQHPQMAMNGGGFAAAANGKPAHRGLKLSTFGCLVMIHALHNNLWEQRQYHYKKTWTNEETENLCKHMEPALHAWRATWDRHPQHSLTRPSPHGPLAADAIPLYDLAFVRLHVDLGHSKEYFWSRDWVGMVNELRYGSEIVQHAGQSPGLDADSNPTSAPDSACEITPVFHGSSFAMNSSGTFSSPRFSQRTSRSMHSGSTRLVGRRERQLRKAAYYAAESLVNSGRLGVTFADFNSRVLPLTAVLCTFDCAQVLAEWIATLQDRIGPYLGILGQNDVDYSQLPAVMFVEEEDIKLIKMIEEIIGTAKTKLLGDRSVMSNCLDPRLQEHGAYAVQILAVTSLMFERASVWPGR